MFPSTGVASGIVTGIGLLVLMVLQGVFRAVMINGYITRYTGSRLSRGV
jgi:hypothetical protein